jgi:hypothetical protein
MRLETSGHKELVRWVLSWMPDVRVLAPKACVMESPSSWRRDFESTPGTTGQERTAEDFEIPKARSAVFLEI